MGRFHKFFGGLTNLTTAPREQRAIAAIPENQAVLCESCHTVIALRGFVMGVNPGDVCPLCKSNNLKFLAAWIRTPEEQKVHWEGRKVRFVKAINGGVPKRIERETPLELAAGKKTA